MAKTQTTCYKCGSSLESRLFCFSCKSVQTINSEIDFFSLFGISKVFDVDEIELEERYNNLSFCLHPDFFGTAIDFEKSLSEKASAILNRAYKTLSEPISRADYLLKLISQDLKLDERSLPEGFLGEMFMLQETLEEFLESNNKSELSSLKDNLTERQNKIKSEFSPIFKKLELNPGEIKLLQKLQTNLNAERYLFRLLERIN